MTAIAVIACALIVLLLSQAVRGEKRDHFGTFADEAAHYLTALMIRDYAAAGFPAHPVAFALNYYTHRPKVAFGAWPPFFHITLAAWMLLFPVSAASVLFYTTLVSAVLVGVFFAFARREFSLPQSLAMAAAVALAPQLHELSSMVLADTLHAMLCVISIYSLSIYLDERRPAFMLGAGLAAALAFLTKNNAVLLAIAIPMTVVLCRAWWIFRKKATWVAAAIAAILTGGWELWAMRWVLGLVMHTTTLSEAVHFYSRALVTVVGPPLFLLAVAGAAAAVAGSLRAHAPVRPIYAASLSLIVGTWSFHSMLPHETFERYMLPAVPAAAVLAAYAIDTLVAQLSSPVAARLTAVLAWAGVLAFQGYGALHAPISRDTVYPEIAQFALQNTPRNAEGVVLVSSDRDGEGDLIAEVSAREPQPHLWLLRASKVLGHSGWHGEDYKLRFHSDDEVLHYLDSVPVNYVVVDPPSGWRQPHHMQLRAVIAAHPEHFSLVLHTHAGQNCRGDYCDVEVYRYLAPDNGRARQIGVDAKEMIGRRLFSDWDVTQK